MWIEALIVGLLISIVRGGRFSNLERSSLRGISVLVFGLVFQLLPFFLHGFAFFKQYAAMFSFLGLCLAALFIALNIKLPGMKLIMGGASLNLIVLSFHNFKMPIAITDTALVELAQMKLNITTGAIANYTMMSQSTSITRYLGKLWTMPAFYPFSRFFGIPDILVAIGVIWLLQYELSNKVTGYGRGGYYNHHYNR